MIHVRDGGNPQDRAAALTEPMHFPDNPPSIMNACQAMKILADSFSLHEMSMRKENGKLVFSDERNNITLADETRSERVLSGMIDYSYSKPRNNKYVPGGEKPLRFGFLPEIRESLADLVQACDGNMHPSTIFNQVIQHLMKDYRGNNVSIRYVMNQPADRMVFTIKGDYPLSLKKDLIEDDPYFTSFSSDGFVVLGRSEKDFKAKKERMSAEEMPVLIKKAKENYALVSGLHDPIVGELDEAAFYAGKLEFIADALLLKAELNKDRKLLNLSIELKKAAYKLATDMLFYGKNHPAELLSQPTYPEVICGIGGHLERLDELSGKQPTK